MRPMAVLLAMLLAACGATVQPSVAAADPSTRAEPSIAEPSAGVSSSAAPLLGLQRRPVGSVEGAPLGYLEHLPPDYGAGQRSPLLIFLHGSEEAGNGSANTLDLVAELGIPQMIAAGKWPDERPFVVLAPQYPTAPAQGRCDIADEVAAFLEFAIDHYDVDPARVYLTGISCGAIGLWDYLAVHGEDGVVAAAVPISGHARWALDKVGTACGRLGSTAVWAFHGADDDVVPVDFFQRPMNAVIKCFRPDWTVTVYPDAGHIEPIDLTYDLSGGHDIYGWMLDRTNKPDP